MVAAVVAASGCGAPAPEPEAPRYSQSRCESLELVCNVDTLAGLDAERDPIGVGADRVDWINENVENGDIIEFMTLLRVKTFSEQSEALRIEAAKYGIDSCPLVHSLALSAETLG